MLWIAGNQSLCNRWLESQRDVGLVGRTECQSFTIEGLAYPDNLANSFKCGNWMGWFCSLILGKAQPIHSHF